MTANSHYFDGEERKPLVRINADFGYLFLIPSALPHFVPSLTAYKTGSLYPHADSSDIRDVDATVFQSHSLDPLPAPQIIIGGPPCQPFTRVGRAKLREIAKNAAAHVHDPRVTFYEHYLRFIDNLRPLAFVMENVPDLCRFAGRNIAEEVALTAEELGYEVRYTLLNSAWYGTPQTRERVFIIGLRRELGQIPVFPPRTHALQIPRGYWTGRLTNGDVPVLPPHHHYCPAAEEVINATPALTAFDALSDLPPITDHLSHMQARKGARRFSNPLTYTSTPANHYQKLMRSWPGLQATTAPADHVIRFTPRDYHTFRDMLHGDQYPEAYKVALNRFEQALLKEEKLSGTRPRPGGKRYEGIKRTIVPPYDPKKFPNKWRKMEPKAPARTIPAHIGKDSYSHIHYDSNQARMISVREAARLQSFPDAFRFEGSMNQAFRQIGNSVPPLLAYAVAASVRRQLIAISIGHMRQELQHFITSGAMSQTSWAGGPQRVDIPELLFESVTIEEKQGAEGLVLGGH